MPRFLARENARKVPASAVLLTNIVIQTFLISTLFSEDAFTAALKMRSAMILIPYLLVAAYALKLAWTGETYASETRSRRVDLARGAFTTLYVIGMIYAGGLKFVLLSALIYAPGVILFVIAQREQDKRLFRPSELLVFGAAGHRRAGGDLGPLFGHDHHLSGQGPSATCERRSSGRALAARRLRAALNGLAETASTPERIAAVRRYAAHLRRDPVRADDRLGELCE